MMTRIRIFVFMSFIALGANASGAEWDTLGTDGVAHYKVSVKGDSLTVRMPDYFNPIHLGDLSESERREVEARKGTIYTWINSRLTQKPDSR